MDYMGKLKVWNAVKEAINKIYDPKTKKLYYKTLLLKAIDEWGFNPENPTKIKQSTEIKLEKWEQEVLDRIKAAQEYGIDIRTAEEKKNLDIGFRVEMLKFVKEGGKLSDLPENLRHEKVIIDGYFNVLEKLYGV